jgi:hypothetical protein
MILPQLCFSVKEGHPVLHTPLSGRLHFSLPSFHPNNGPSPGVVCVVGIWAEHSENNPECKFSWVDGCKFFCLKVYTVYTKPIVRRPTSPSPYFHKLNFRRPTSTR